MTEHVLHGAQIVGLAVGQRGAGVAQRVVRHVGSFDVGGAQVAVADVPYATSSQAVAAGEVAVGSAQRLDEFVRRDAAAVAM